jgi:hypothetical protein
MVPLQNDDDDTFEIASTVRHERARGTKVRSRYVVGVTRELVIHVDTSLLVSRWMMVVTR